jgi:hypothetical protein
MFQKTSKEGEVHQEPPPADQARLWDYDIEGAQFKSRHKAFLDKIIAKIKSKPDQEWVIVIGGTADTLGKGKFDNKALSEQRANVVANYLRQHLRQAKVTIDPKGFGDEPAAAKDAANVRDDWFRAVDVALTAPGAPRPRRPHFPKVLPKKDHPLPKPDRPAACVKDADCPRANVFTVELVFGASGGEVAEASVFDFLIRDKKNGLSATYRLRQLGVGAGSPFSISAAGKPKEFRTSKEVRVTRFGPPGSFSSATVPVPPVLVAGGLLILTFRPDGATFPNLQPPIFPLDTGPIPIPGASAHLGVLSLQTQCKGEPGASRF